MSDHSDPEGTELPDGESRQTMDQVVRQLYEVMRQDLGFEEKARQALELGRAFLSVDNGHLTRIDQETDYWEALVSSDPPEGQFPPGLELDLDTTYCRRTVDSGSQISLNDAPNQGWDDDPAFETHGLHCYLGTPIVLDEEVYGTVCFVSSNRRKEPFSEGEKLVAELITHMLERELERERYESQLTKQRNMSVVLNRILRHNLRNDMAVIRGFTKLMSDKLTDSNLGQQAIQSIDNLIDLGEKARVLDEVVASDEEPHQRDIRTIVDEVIAGVRSEYPSASIFIEGDEKVTGAVLPSFKRGVKELIENAAKHGGDQPVVEVSVESVPNAIEIQISDNGPGLDSQELGALRSGAETPLLHGSGLGLWLTHWIISSHDGSIDATVSDEGTTLAIRIPRSSMQEGHQRLGELVRARDQYEAAFNLAGDGMTITDDQARILDVNEQAARIYGEDRRELMGRSMKDFVTDDFDFEEEWGEIKAAKMMRDEMKIASGDGGVRPIEYTAKTDIVPGHHLIISRDISDRKEREQELKDKQARFKAVFEDSFDAMVITDDTGAYIKVNEAAADLFGLPREEMVGRSIDEFTPEDFDFDKEWNKFQKSDNERGTVPIIRADGSKRIVEYAATPDIIPGQHLSILRDITEREEQKQTLLETKQRLEAIIELSPDPILAADASGAVFLWNQAAEDVFGISAEKAIGGQIESVVGFVDEQSSKFQEGFERILSGETLRDIEVKRERNDGTIIDLNISATPLRDASNSVTGVIGVAQDITAQKKRQEELVQYEAAFKKAGDGMTITDDEARILDVNDEAAQLYGVDKQELIGQSMKDFLPDDFDFEAEWGEIQAAKMKRDEMKIASADGGVNPVEYTAKTDIVPGQHLIVSRDITERKEHEREISALKQRYQTLLEEIPAPVIITDIETDEIIETNSALETLLGTSRGQLLGDRLEALFPDDDIDQYQEVFGAPYGDAETITQLPDGSPPTLLTADGETPPVEASVGTVALPDREVMVGLFRNVSDLEDGADTLPERNEQLEEFASVVSHDLRNPLNVANGRLELAMEDCDSEHLKTIEDAHERMEGLIADLLVLAQQGEAVAEPESVALANLVDSCWENVDTEPAALDVDVDRTIRADGSRVKQIFENLFRNAVEHGGEEVTVTVGALAGGFFVEDDGPGIPESKRDAVFEAGYSTRDEGSGFGLNIVKEVVEAHGWEIRVTEGSRGGARFEVTGVEFTAE